MKAVDDDLKLLGRELRCARRASLDLVASLRKLIRQNSSSRTRQKVSAGDAYQSQRTQHDKTRRDKGVVARLMPGMNQAGNLQRMLGQGIQGLFKRLASNLIRTAMSSFRNRMGGGLMGGVLGNLVGSGLNMLVAGLFKRHRTVRVENTVRTEVMNFPRLTNLTLAANPASRLFGNRAIARGPSFNVTVEYRQGAEELVAAKVATRLAELNDLHGMG